MKRKAITAILGGTLLAAAFLLLSSCASVIVNPLLDPLTLSLQKQTDLELLQAGMDRSRIDLAPPVGIGHNQRERRGIGAAGKPGAPDRPASRPRLRHGAHG